MMRFAKLFRNTDNSAAQQKNTTKLCERRRNRTVANYFMFKAPVVVVSDDVEAAPSFLSVVTIVVMAEREVNGGTN